MNKVSLVKKTGVLPVFFAASFLIMAATHAAYAQTDTRSDGFSGVSSSAASPEGMPASFVRYQSPLRVEILNPPEVVKTLKIAPGMVIADIGAGTGLFTFIFAEALAGSGQVVAVDIEKNNVSYIKNEARRLGYKNISTILAGPLHPDPALKKYAFDIIFLCDVYEYLHHPQDYFTQLRPSLKEETGRLYIIYFDQSGPLTKYAFPDLYATFRELASRSDGYPIFDKLSVDMKEFIRTNKYKLFTITDEITSKFLADINAMLYDATLYSDLENYYAVTEPGALLISRLRIEDRPLAKWLRSSLDKKGVFESKQVPEPDREALFMLNKILLIDMLSGVNVYGSSPMVYYDKSRVVATLEKAGYIFMGEKNLLPCHYLLEFKRRD